MLELESAVGMLKKFETREVLDFSQVLLSIESILEQVEISKIPKKTRILIFSVLGKIKFENAELSRNAPEQITKEEIESAIEDGRILPAFQPIVDVETLEIKKYEVLMRLQTRNGEVISPGFFMERAREEDLLYPMKKIMIPKVFEKLAKKGLYFSFNAGDKELENVEKCCELIEKECERRNFPKEKITIELLESVHHVAKNIFENFKRRGFKIAIDDFGSHNSDFLRIFEFAEHLNFLKIDGKKIEEMEEDPESLEIIKFAIEFIQILNKQREKEIEIIGEFVKKSQLKKLRELGIHYAQGFELGLPSLEV